MIHLVTLNPALDFSFQPRDPMGGKIGKLLDSSLVVTAITKDPVFIEQLVSSPQIDRLNIGAMPTNQVSWDQPHEGNLFEHLYARRAFQHAVAV